MTGAAGSSRGARFEQLSIWLAVFSVLVFLSGGFDRWAIPKDALLAVACVFGALAPRVGRLPKWLVALIAVGSAILLAAALVSSAPLSELFGRYPRYEGLVSLSAYAGALWLGSRLLAGGGRPRSRETVLRAVSWGAVLLGAVSIAQASGWKLIDTTASRPGALLGNATDQGVVGVMFFAILAMPCVRALFPNPLPDVRGSRQKRNVAVAARLPLVAVAGVVGAAATTVISGSRAALVAWGVVLIGIVVEELVRARVMFRGRRPDPATGWRRIRRVALVGVGVIAGVGVLLFVFPLALSRLLGFSPLADKTVAERITIYQAAVAVVVKHPLLGVGPSGFIDAVPKALGPAWYSEVGPDATLDSPHSWILQAVEAGGIPLLVLTIFLVVSGAIVGVSHWRTLVSVGGSRDAADFTVAAGIAVFGAAVGLLAQFTSPGPAILAAFLLGAVVGAPTGRMAATAPARTALRVGGVAALTAWALTLLVFAYAEIPLETGANDATAGRVADANASFSLALALRPWDADMASDAAQVLAEAATNQVGGAAPAAVDYAKRALSATPNSIEALKALAVGQQYSGNFRGSERTLELLRKIVPLDEGVALRLGGVQVLSKQWMRARLTLELATRLAPKDPAPWKTLQYLYQETGNARAAASAAATAARLSRHG